MHILLTGAAGFIGYRTACALLERGDTVVGLENLNPFLKRPPPELHRLECR